MNWRAINWRHTLAVVVAASASLALLDVPTLAQNGNVFKGRLSKVPVDAKMVPIMVGTGNATATLAGTRVTIGGTFDGLGSPVTAVRLHESQFRGMRGKVVADLTAPKAASGAISGNVDLTPAQVTALKAGRLYVQIHTEAGQEGHLWGWLLP
jgi:hypothetical protein